MKKIMFLFLIIVSSMSVYSQKLNDEIVLKSGGKLKCHIIEVDTVANTIKYIVSKMDGPKQIELENVKTYTRNNTTSKGKAITGFLENSIRTNIQDKYQKIDEEEKTAGQHLKTFATTAQIGLGISLIGAGLAALPSALPTENRDPLLLEQRNNQLRTAGIIVSAVGFITLFVSFDSARRAGKLIKQNNSAYLGVSNDGLTLKIPIN
jgi:hypothetical protein